MKDYTILLVTSNLPSLLGRVTLMLNRRKTNIIKLVAAETEAQGVYRFCITVHTTKESVVQLIKLFDKQIDVYSAFYFSGKQSKQNRFAHSLLNVS